MLAGLRQVASPNAQMHAGVWQRHFGRRMAACTFGIIGASRIGSCVIQHLQEFRPPCIIVNDIAREPTLASCYPLEWASKEEIFREADVISLHLPLTHNTRNLIRTEQLLMMKSDAVLINTARGGIIHEQELAAVLRAGVSFMSRSWRRYCARGIWAARRSMCLSASLIAVNWQGLNAAC